MSQILSVSPIFKNRHGPSLHVYEHYGRSIYSNLLPILKTKLAILSHYLLLLLFFVYSDDDLFLCRPRF